LSIKGPELLDMYIGESERNVRTVFAQARAAAPSVLFFDELDSLAPQRGRGSDSGGVMDRFVAQLRVELEGVSWGGGGGEGGKEGPRKDVFVIGATNRPDLLDSSLLRPGRFDRLLYLGNSQDPTNRLSILQAPTRKFSLAFNVNLEEVIARVPVTFTGADFSAVAAQALMRALKRRVAELEEELEVLNEEDGEGGREGGKEGVLSLSTFLSQLAPEELEARVRQEDFVAAAAAVTPSVSMEELQHYEKLRAQFSSSHVAVAAAPSLPSSSLPLKGGGGGGGLKPPAATAAANDGGGNGTAAAAAAAAAASPPRGLGGGLTKGGIERPKDKKGSHGGGRGGGRGGGGGVEESKSGGGRNVAGERG